MRWSEGELVFKPWSSLRIFGVLQRIALAYFGAALIVHFCKPKQVFIAALSLLIGYWLHACFPLVILLWKETQYLN